jgi:hypothetical protein
VRARAVEHEAEEKAPARAGEVARDQASVVTLGPPGIPAGLAGAPFLLALQARAGNAAVAALIEQHRTAEQTVDKPEVATSEAPPPEGTELQATGTEPSPAEAVAGPSDDDMTRLDAAAEAPAPDHQAEADSAKQMAARDAQNELAQTGTSNSDSAADSGGGSEPGIAIAERAPPAVPDVSASDPSVALARVAALPPAPLLGSLGSVSAAVGREAAQDQQRLSASPPQRARHPGAPATVDAPASSRVVIAERSPREIPKAEEASEVAIRPPSELPVVPELRAPAGEIPLRDPGLELKAGALPHLPIEGNADPGTVQQQHRQVIGHIEKERLEEAQVAKQLLGEDQIFPSVPPETLRGMVPGSPAANGHGAAIDRAEGDDAASIIAQQEKGDEIRGAISTGLSSLAERRQQYGEHSSAERAKADAEMTQLEQANSAEQTAERAAAKQDVLGLRSQWSQGQHELVAGAQREADAKTSETLALVARERGAGEQQAAAHYHQGQQEADLARRQAEQQAVAEKKKAQGGGVGSVLAAIGSAAQSLFDKAKQAVVSVFDRARQLVKSAIDRARQLATEVLERARLVIVGTLRTAGNALTAIGDRVLVAFPVLRDRFRRMIQDRIAAAEASVNRLAAVLKQSVQAVLNGLSTVLVAAIGLMRQGMQAAIDGVGATVRGALDFARGAIAALGTFAVLVKDIAANPGQWVRNLAAAARDGIKNHLWPDLKAVVQGWFNEKLDTVLGLGSAVWSLLKRGGVTVAQVATTVWEGLKALIPQTVIWVLIEKLVALIVPAAAAVILIIQALQAAWASIGRIIQAADAFVAFLKGVRWGDAGPLFASALAKSAVAAIEFVSQFLLQRLIGAAGAVAGKIRTLAKRIGARLAVAGRGLAKGAKVIGTNAANAVKRAAGFTREAIARPQVRWHAWRLRRSLGGQPRALRKLAQLRSDPAIDPSLKLRFLRLVPPRLGPGSDARALMNSIVQENESTFCRQGRQLTAAEISSVAPMTKLVSLADIFDKGMLADEYQKRFASFAEWQAALKKDPSIFNPKRHLKPGAEIGRWWSPLADTNERSLEAAIDTRQLEGNYEQGAVRAHLAPEAAVKATFYKPTAFDAMFFDSWQTPPTKGAWGFIRTQNGAIIIREAVTRPVTADVCSEFETLLPSPGEVSTASDVTVKALEALP